MASESDRAGVLEEFMAMTGTTEDFAISFLDASDWNVEQAMELFLGGQGGVAQDTRAASSSSGESEQEASIRRIMQQYDVDRETALAIREAGGGSEGASGAGAVDADGVRAPILQKRARLFDTFDHEEELSEDMSALHVNNSLEAQLFLARQMMTQGAAAASLPQRPSMFAPPRWMMFLGSFEEARAEAKAKKRWIMVNIQDEQEFQSLVLNRDLWSDETAQSLIKESFLFWQQERPSPEAQRFITLYNPTPPFPHVCIIDPRTGERLRILKLKKKEDDLRESFFEQVTEFLDVNSFESKSKGAGSSLPKRQPQSSEDIELEEAIRASLGTETEKSAALKPAAATGAPSRPIADKVTQEKASPSSLPPAPQFPVLVPEPPASSEATMVQFKFPDGTRAKRRFTKTDAVSMLFSFIVDSKKVPVGTRFDLMTSDIPARSLLASLDRTLADADACNQNMLVRLLE